MIFKKRYEPGDFKTSVEYCILPKRYKGDWYWLEKIKVLWYYYEGDVHGGSWGIIEKKVAKDDSILDQAYWWKEHLNNNPLFKLADKEDKTND